MSMQACEGDLTLQVILYGVQGKLHLGWWKSLASIIWSPLLPVPWREAREQDQDWMDHRFILHMSGLGSHTIPCPYIVPYTPFCWRTQGLDAAGHSSLQIKALMALEQSEGQVLSEGQVSHYAGKAGEMSIASLKSFIMLAIGPLCDPWKGFFFPFLV